jgi:signal transduction histidine kinase/CheY-like chemotaxis protein
VGLRRPLPVAIIATLAAFIAVCAATPLSRDIRVPAIDLGWLLLSVLCAASAWQASREAANRHLRTPFRCFAAGAGVWALGQLVWTYQEVVQDLESPVFQLADVGFWLSLPLLAAGVLTWPRVPVRWQLGTVLDFALISGFALLFGLEFMLQPLLEHDSGGLGFAYAILYPPGEVLLFGCVVAVLLLDHWRERRRIELISLGLMAMLVADAGYTYLGEAYVTGGWLDPLWAIGFATVGLAAAAPAAWSERPGWVSNRVLAVAPSAALFLVALFGIAVAVSGRPPLGAPERIAIYTLVLLLALRQGHTQLRLLDQMEEQRRLEQQLQHAQKLEAVGRLAGGVAHDFNNILTAIAGYSELALQQLAPNHPVRGDIDEVRRSARRASELTRQLLAFSRRQVLAPQIVDLNAVVLDAQRMLGRLLGGDIDLQTTLAVAPALVRADQGQLEQVVTNLVLNARDAMPQGGSIRIETIAGRDTVLLSVEDDGLGMDDATRELIFEPFFTTKDPGKGTGLGLAMVHGIVTQSSGSITVDSAPGRGARFELVFPRVALGAVPEAAAVEVAPGPGTETVLVVEDEPAVRDLARRILELEGYAVVTASSGEEALRLWDDVGPVDALLTDIVMPGLGGRELAATLTSRSPRLRVVLMSGYTQNAEQLDGLLASGAAFVEKPFTSSALVTEVRGVLDAAAA